ncbi:unnamed protein product, partial [Prunus brigantina]
IECEAPLWLIKHSHCLAAHVVECVAVLSTWLFVSPLADLNTWLYSCPLGSHLICLPFG